MSHSADQDQRRSSKAKSPGLALVLGLLLGGVAFFYVRSWRRALLPALAAYVCIAVSGGVLWLPVNLFVALWAARDAKFSEPDLAFRGVAETHAGNIEGWHLAQQTPPLPYLTVRRVSAKEAPR